MNSIDSLTLQLLTSKKKYNNYLSTTDPVKAQSNNDYIRDVKKNKLRLQSLLGAYLENPEKQTTNEVDNSIEMCFKSLLRHFSMRDREDKSARYGYDEEDSTDEDDAMFKDENDEKEEEAEYDESEDNYTDNVAPVTQSLWGNKITKTKPASIPIQPQLPLKTKNAFALMRAYEKTATPRTKPTKKSAIMDVNDD